MYVTTSSEERKGEHRDDGTNGDTCLTDGDGLLMYLLSYCPGIMSLSLGLIISCLTRWLSTLYVALSRDYHLVLYSPLCPDFAASVIFDSGPCCLWRGDLDQFSILGDYLPSSPRRVYLPRFLTDRETIYRSADDNIQSVLRRIKYKRCKYRSGVLAS